MRPLLPPRARLALAGSLAALLAPGCQGYTVRDLPLPEISAVALEDGAVIDRESLSRKPWIITLWLPG